MHAPTVVLNNCQAPISSVTPHPSMVVPSSLQPPAVIGNVALTTAKEGVIEEVSKSVEKVTKDDSSTKEVRESLKSTGSSAKDVRDGAKSMGDSAREVSDPGKSSPAPLPWHPPIEA